MNKKDITPIKYNNVIFPYSYSQTSCLSIIFNKLCELKYVYSNGLVWNTTGKFLVGIYLRNWKGFGF